MVEIVISVAAKIAEYLVAPVGRPFRYLWNYKTNLENLKEPVKKLERRIETVEDLIKVGEEPLPHVKYWQQRANRIIPEALELIKEDNPEQANIQCCKGFSCPNLMNRYQLSKKAGKLKSDVVGLEQEAAKFKEVSKPTILEEPWPRSSKGYDAFESRTDILKNIIDALRDPDVNMVGIYGMGCIGKTTLAREVAREAKQHNLFDKIVFVEVSESPDIKNIQGVIADILGLHFKEETVLGRANRLCDQLKKEGKILLILDNIWKGIDLGEIGIPFKNDHKGLKILLTTRSHSVLTNDMDCQRNFQVLTLNEADAWSLFKDTAGTCVDYPNLQSIAFEVAKECGGMPLAIVTIAKALKNKEEYVWIHALKNLKSPSLESFERIMTKSVYTSIKMSYDYLDTTELKEIFLLCSRMGRTYDASIRDLLMYGLGLGFFKRSNTLEQAQCMVEDFVKKLKDNSLLLDAPIETRDSLWYGIPDGERFAMHDVICDVARSIAREKGNVCIVIDDVISCSWAKKNILKNCTSITLHNIGELPKDLKLVLPQLKFFYMKPKIPFSRITDDFFTDISSLLVLHLIEMNLSPLPTSLSHLVNLQTLCLDACKLGDIADIGKLEKLEILSFRSSEIKKLPEEMRKLTSIRLLDLTHCSTLEIIPPNVISCFTQLEAFYMYGTLIRWEDGGLNIVGKNASLDELKHLCDRLATLEICIPNVKMLEGLLSPQLKRYKISIADNRISPPKNSRTLRVKLNTNDNADEVISQLKGIKQLELCADLKDDFTDSKQAVSLDALFSLESLSLEDLYFEKICNVPLAAESFCQLRTITVLRCDKLTNIFSFSIDRVLPKLKEIEVSSCKNMEGIFAIEREDDVNNSELIHEIQFSQLCSVTLTRLPQLKSFCHRVKTTSQLQLTNDGEIISEDMMDIPKSLFNEKIGFPSLKAMEINDCPKVKEFIFNDKVAVPNLEKLKISCMDNLEKIWHNQLVNDSFCKLKSLEVEGCMKLLNVFPSNIHGRLLSLESLVVTACGSLEEIFDLRELSIYDSQIMLSFENLQKLGVSKCHSLKNLFSASIHSILAKEVVMEEAPAIFLFPKLTSLELKYLPQLRSFYPGRHKVEGPVLKTLVLSLCDIRDTNEEGQMQQPFLLFLVEEAFHCLEELELTGKNVTMLLYDESTILPFGLIQRCRNLEKLLLHGISYKEIFQQGEDQTRTKIKTLHLYYLTNLKYIWKQNSKLDLIIQNLEVLKVGWCHNLINLMPPPTSFQNPSTSFKNLTSLEVKHCNSLINMGTSTVAKSLLQLIEMSISSCEKITEVIGNHGDVTEDEIIFRKLKSLTLQDLPRLTSFCSLNFTLKFPSLETLTVEKCLDMKIFSQGDLTMQKLQIVTIDQESVELRPNFHLNKAIQQSYEKAVGSRGIENLTLSKFLHLKEVWHNQNSVSIFGNLKSLVVADNDCSSLRYIPSVALDLVQLRELKITNCGILETIIGIEEERTDDILFPNLNRLELKDLPKLSGFCNFAGNSIKLPSLTQLWIDNCPKMETFILNSIDADIPASKENFHRDIKPFFDEKVGFPSLENMVISGMDNLKSIWHNQFLGDSFSFPKLKSVEVNDCQELKTIFPSCICGRLSRLESLTVKSCGLVEEIFNFQWLNLKEKQSIEATTQLRELYVDHMSNLKRIWNKDPKGMLSYGKLQKVTVFLCPNLENLFPASVAKSLLNLVSLDVSDCGLLEEIIATGGVNEDADRLLFPKLSSLQLHNLPQLRTFCTGQTVELSCLKRLGLHHCDNVKLFISEFLGFYETIELEGTNQGLPNLEELHLSGKEITMEWLDQVPGHVFRSVKSLELNELESTVLPLHFIQKFGSMGKLSLNSSSYMEISSYGEVKEHPQIKHLVLGGLFDLKQIWKQGLKIDPKFQNLEILEVRSCFNLINLMPSSVSFQNLMILEVWGCDGLKNLLTSSTAKSLVLLEKLELFDCKMLIEVVANEGAETEEINFRKLKSLSLMYLQSLASFCSMKHILNFPILESLVVNECPKMKIFSDGVMSTPELHKLEVNWEACEQSWEVGVNATIKQNMEKRSKGNGRNMKMGGGRKQGSRNEGRDGGT